MLLTWRAIDAELTRIGQRLDALEHRLDAWRKSANRRVQSLHQPPQNTNRRKRAPSFCSCRAVARSHFTGAQTRIRSPCSPQSTPDNSASRQQREKELNSLQSDVTTTRQQWVATADRLGNVVGELSTQREEITRDRESLEQLEEHFQRDSVPFTLKKDGNEQQVGPVRLLLENTDTKNSRYTMRLLFGEKSIELKGRALHEAIQFYAPEGNLALELIVSQITKSSVAGRVSVPQTRASR